jgi:uncharacterized membrane protein HdeD (DUF308 family)
MNEQPRPVHRRGEANVARRQPPAGPKQHVALGEIEPGAADITALRRAFADLDPVAIALGILAFAYPGPTLAALIIVFAVYAIFDGVVALIAGLGMPGGANWWLVLGGIVGIAVGVFTFSQPDTTALALVLLVGIWAIATGVAEIIAAVTLRGLITNGWLIGLTGVVSVIFGLLLVISPNDGILSVLWLVGFYAIFAGVMYLSVGLRLRDVADSVSSLRQEGTAAGGTTAGGSTAGS